MKPHPLRSRELAKQMRAMWPQSERSYCAWCGPNTRQRFRYHWRCVIRGWWGIWTTRIKFAVGYYPLKRWGPR